MSDSFWARHVEICTKINGKRYPVPSSVVNSLLKSFDQRNLPRPSTTQIQALMNSPSANGEASKAYTLIRYYQVSQQGLFVTNENTDKFGTTIKYTGAENWESVMCYMDALLFAMFANLDSFEPMLFLSNQSQNILVNRLSNLLRVYVNLLRTGNLIKTDLTIRICETLHQLGFTEAMSHKQQDASPLFEFLAETLSMPLLTFKIDIQHGGKFNEEDDRKYSKERMLFVSIPEVVSGESNNENEILLEECLEHYFNNSINVKRELERRATMESSKNHKPFTEMIETVEDPTELTHESGSISKGSSRIQVRTRSSTLSIWTVNDNEPNSKPKEVSLPAWMFLRLLPFYTDDNDVSVSENGKTDSIAKGSREFAKRRPVLPICLKRYSFENKRANRSQVKVIIPPVINLPSFVADENDDNKTSHNYKLILESAICHRGTSTTSGHFVAAVRRNYQRVNETDDESYCAEWYLYDDLHKPKVVEKSFKEIFNTEWPYILFYRLISYEESESSANSIRSGQSSTNSPRVIIPQGSKSKYWQEDTLSPILSASNSPSFKSESAIDSLNKSLTNMSANSEGGSDTAPPESKHVDIRDRYYWYIPDSNMDYYKEDSLSKVSTRRTSFTAPFRKNSQWSETSATNTKSETSAINTKSPTVDTKSQETPSPSGSMWRFKSKNKSKSPPLETHEIESMVSHMSLTNPEPHIETITDVHSNPERSKIDTRHHHHILHRHNHDEINNSYKRSRSMREAYRKEKCIIC
ncbi:hypothetical protein CANTEDRAFT_123876 [Yamadazyma tenuis ATCC 10573]|uniref:USP domain-containing protein n=1 Tax=Candida tenuis (strain ATCC 10573 / BCRC 21748 / CBS 615 / JCM 9827 / NBRC 10315 / NRRL Y-1498 / VKM Y-70) TaxID=590646 RepID=G3B9X1_CANTC|nr:uncharacterized protein CANTEDRAFT_123876 [Yamadazyma tenuis ATCC 10573]EGV61347.1 hypothetical protein CANTEDRAFT_123876 [Yamadazyma tenuis ATCC 10573]